MAKIENAAISELAGIPSIPKKRGRPSTGKALSNADRQSAFRNKKRLAVASLDSVNFDSAPDDILLMRLADAIKRTKDSDPESSDTGRWLFDLVIVELKKRYSNV